MRTEINESRADLAISRIPIVLQMIMIVIAPRQNTENVGLHIIIMQNPTNAPRKLALILLKAKTRDFSLIGDITKGI
jgi:hypothetical protein